MRNRSMMVASLEPVGGSGVEPVHQTSESRRWLSLAEGLGSMRE